MKRLAACAVGAALLLPAPASAADGPGRVFWRFEQATHNGRMTEACDDYLTTGLARSIQHTVGRGLDCADSLRRLHGWPTHPMSRIHVSVHGRRAVVRAGTVRASLFRESGAWWLRTYKPSRDGLTLEAG